MIESLYCFPEYEPCRLPELEVRVAVLKPDEI